MVKFWILSIAAGVLHAIGFYILGSVMVTTLPDFDSASLFVKLLGIGLAAGLVYTTAICFGTVFHLLFCTFAVEVRSGNTYGFRDNVLGRWLARKYSKPDGKLSFCKLYTGLSLTSSFAIAIIVCFSLLISEATGNDIAQLFDEIYYFFTFEWIGTINLVANLKFAMFLLTLAFVVVAAYHFFKFLADTVNKKLENTKAGQLYKKNICPIIETD